MLRLLAEFYATPWALDESIHAQMKMIIERWASGVRLSQQEIQAAVGSAPQAAAQRRDDTVQAGGGAVAVLPIHGILTHRAHVADGAISTQLTSTERLAAQLRAAVANAEISSIVLDVDSPGGSVFGVQELADALYGMRGSKPIIGVANSNAASGAYWVLAQCDEVYITPSGQVGSIGAYMMHTDRSGKQSQAGEKHTFISAGKYKVEGNDSGPLEPASLEYLQSMIDSYYSMFVRAVAKGRGVSVEAVRGPEFGQGRMRLAKDAVQAGMANGIATFDEVVARQLKAAQRRGPEKRGLAAATAAAQIAVIEAGNPIAV